ncbi:MAG: tetratricopeptide repeat protein [Caulobacter sp.]|nr:tetratricopeptide repeat protein [Vitreoscilla sp.]
MPMSRRSLFARGRRAALPARLLVAAAVGLLAGCASLQPELRAATPGMFDDAHVAPAREPIDPADVFRITPEMQAYIDQVVTPDAGRKGVRQAMTEALYDRAKLKLEYDSSTTRTAAEAFNARQGNCLSLVIMTGAFAKALDLRVTYQQVAIDDTWSRSGGMYFFSGHVNLVLEHYFIDTLGKADRADVYTIDFMPAEGKQKVRPISESTVLAMFMNNRAAEAMVHGQLDDAYWRARQAIQLDPQFFSSYNTLGVVYLRRGDAARAETVLRFALSGHPDDARVLANYEQALRGLGRTAEADAVKAHLAAVEPTPPFYWYAQGQVALHGGDYAKARELFLKELDRAPDYHEFHYALAVADFQLDRLDEARREMALAMEDSVRRSDYDIYAAKLDKLKAWRATKAAPSLVQ